MKKTKLFYFVAGFVIAAMLVLFLANHLLFNRASTELNLSSNTNYDEARVKIGMTSEAANSFSITNEVKAISPPTNQTKAVVLSGTNENMASTIGTNVFKTVTNETTGQYAVVYSDRQFVTLKDKDGNTICFTNIVQVLHGIPIMGGKEIYSLKFWPEAEIVMVYFGRHSYVEINTTTGKASYWGSD